MNTRKTPPILGILITTIGCGWLLTAKDFLPGVNWVWSLGLMVLGILAFVVSRGIDKFSLTVGPFLMVAGVLSALRQTGHLSVETEMLILLITFGVQLVIAQTSNTQLPSWMITEAAEERGTTRA
jgi:hypothetical protein